MLQVVMSTPSGDGKEVRSSMLGKSRKRKPWEFTWDDTSNDAVQGKVGPIKHERAGSECVIESRRPMPERRMKKRKAWEFTWDDQDNRNLSAVSSSIIRQNSLSDSTRTSTNAYDVSSQYSLTPSSVIGAEASKTVDIIDALAIADEAAMESSPSSPGPRSKLPVVREKTKKDMNLSLSDSVETPPLDSESMDIGRVRRQLLSIGQSVFNRKSSSLEEDVSWIRSSRGRHEVQVVHIRPRNKHYVRETANAKDLDSSLRTHPLIENALHALSILRSNPKEVNVSALRRAVRVLREQIAGLEAQAYAYSRPSRPQIPLFNQAYDPKTRTG